MADVVDRRKRSQMMAGIRSKDTKPEKFIRKALHTAGLRYRLHAADLPGKPDLVFPKYKAAVLVHGCFWHRHPHCWWCTQPSSNQTFWTAKFEENVRRDERNLAQLQSLGWRVAVVWECAMKLREPGEVADSLRTWLTSPAPRLTLPADQEKRRSPSAGKTESGRPLTERKNHPTHAPRSSIRRASIPRGTP